MIHTKPLKHGYYIRIHGRTRPQHSIVWVGSAGLQETRWASPILENIFYDDLRVVDDSMNAYILEDELIYIGIERNLTVVKQDFPEFFL